MIELCRTTILQAIADLICLSVILFLYAAVSPVRVVFVYYVSKVVVFSLYRFGAKL